MLTPHGPSVNNSPLSETDADAIAIGTDRGAPSTGGVDRSLLLENRPPPLFCNFSNNCFFLLGWSSQPSVWEDAHSVDEDPLPSLEVAHASRLAFHCSPLKIAPLRSSPFLPSQADISGCGPTYHFAGPHLEPSHPCRAHSTNSWALSFVPLFSITLVWPGPAPHFGPAPPGPSSRAFGANCTLPKAFTDFMGLPTATISFEPTMKVGSPTIPDPLLFTTDPNIEEPADVPLSLKLSPLGPLAPGTRRSSRLANKKGTPMLDLAVARKSVRMTGFPQSPPLTLTCQPSAIDTAMTLKQIKIRSKCAKLGVVLQEGDAPAFLEHLNPVN